MALWSAIWKELLVLVRDRGGIALLFLMPTAMVTIMTIVQDAPFKDHHGQKIPILVFDQDGGTVAQNIIASLDSSDAFKVIKTLEEEELTLKSFNKTINSGDVQIGIVLGENLSEDLDQAVSEKIGTMLAIINPNGTDSSKQELRAPLISIIMDPATKKTFRISIRMALDQFIAQLEGRMLLDKLAEDLSEMSGSENNSNQSIGNMVNITEGVASTEDVEDTIASNSTQHNVPAWTVFAMFFIVIPLSANMVRERTSGTYSRLSTMSASIAHYYSGKLISFTLVCIAQATIIVLVGLLIFPFISLARLDLGSGLIPLIIASITVGTAATSFGLVVGSIFNTHQQAAIFGVVTVVIMAAMGGIWVPLYAMPENMQIIGKLSPMYWALECFNTVFLRGLGPLEVIGGTYKLWGFSIICILFTLFRGRRLS